MLRLRFIFILIFLSLAGLAAEAYADPRDPTQTSTRRKKLKATPVLKTNQRVIKVRSYVRRGWPVRAHKRTIKTGSH